MQREIKFRLWNGVEWLNVDEITLWDVENEPKGWTFQQYTGLKDKNSVEIYEGDIVRCKSFDGWFDKIGYHYNMEVKYQTLESGDSELSGFLYINIDREVIGNIFENPKLLKA